MMYCVETYEYDQETASVGQKLTCEWFDTLEDAKVYAEGADRADIRGTITETTGDPEDEGKVIFDF